MSRKELYDKVRELCLQETILKKYGKNFTQCSNADLEAVVLSKSTKIVTTTVLKEEETVNPIKTGSSIDNKFNKLVEILGKKRILLASELDAINNA